LQRNFRNLNNFIAFRARARTRARSRNQFLNHVVYKGNLNNKYFNDRIEKKENHKP
jgi:hypothetical protein